MDRLEFRITGLTNSHLERFQRLTRQPGGQPLAWSSKSMILLPVALLVTYGLLTPPSVKIGNQRGLRITANAVLLLIDTSGSMDNYVPRKDAALARLHGAGISTGDQVPIGGSASKILETITRELAKRARVDAIWIVSDFYDGSDLGRNNRYERLLHLLRQRRIKLYLSTVAKKPPQDHIRAALASGGGWDRF